MAGGQQGATAARSPVNIFAAEQEFPVFGVVLKKRGAHVARHLLPLALAMIFAIEGAIGIALKIEIAAEMGSQLNITKDVAAETCAIVRV